MEREGNCLMSASVMGHGVKSPGLSCRWLLASVRGQLRSCHIIRSEEVVRPSLGRSLHNWFCSYCGHCGFTNFTVPATGPRAAVAPTDLLSSPHAMAAVSLVQRKLVPSTHMRWRMTPSLRASATRAFFAPRRLATAIAQLFNGDMRTVRVSITLAAS